MVLIVAAVTEQFPEMPQPRYLHQSTTFISKNESYVMIMGGKTSVHTNEVLKSCYRLKIHDVL